MDQPKRQIVKTSDGSATLYVPGLDEHYHSTHGALQEAKHVFIKMGLDLVSAKSTNINLLEIGLGTGLNALLTYQYALDHQISIKYTGVEKYPLNKEELTAVDYLKLIGDSRLDHFYTKMFAKNIEEIIPIDDLFTLEKQIKDFREIDDFGKYDLIYFDAFGPRVQPHLWEKGMFDLMYRLCRPNGVLVTYCAKGQVRRDMQVAGFEVERLEGPPGKREMLRASKKAS